MFAQEPFHAPSFANRRRRTAWGWLGVIPIATAFAGFCPAYRFLGLNTCATACAE
jgi:hypothetical protein